MAEKNGPTVQLAASNEDGYPILAQLARKYLWFLLQVNGILRVLKDDEVLSLHRWRNSFSKIYEIFEIFKLLAVII